MSRNALVIGLDIGGTKLNAGLVTADGQIVRRLRRPTPARDGGQAVYDAVESVIADLLGAAEAPVSAIGIGSPGHVDVATGQIVYCTPNLPGWSGLPLAEKLQARFGLPVIVDNDANAALYGEVWCGGAKGLRHALMLTLGTGVGGGVLSHGQLVRGARGGGAELGHVIITVDGRPCNCGQSGCLESYASGTAVGAIARERLAAGAASPMADLAGSVAAVTSHHVFTAADQGDPVALGVIETVITHLAAGLVSFINIFQPERILLGGGVAERGDDLLDAIRQATRRRFGSAPLAADLIGLAELGGESGLYGAAGLAWQHAAPAAGADPTP